MNWFKKKIVVPAAAACAAVATAASPASAQVVWPDAHSITTLHEIIDAETLGVATLTLAGGALAVAFALGGGFRVAHKSYRWVMGKTG